jgi:hypothetical protein
MPLFERITYSAHAFTRMRQRRIAPQDVALALRIGEGYEEEDGTWMYELGRVRVVILDRGDEAHVINVIKLKGHP